MLITRIATLLVCTSLIALAVTPALAQQRGQSGMPAGPGNPFATLQSAPADGSAALAVLDATGQKVGDVVGIEEGMVPVVVATFVGQRVALRATANALYGAEVWFEKQGCEGPALLSAQTPVGLASALLPLTGVAPPGRTVYVADPAAVPVLAFVGSRLNVDGSCTSLRFSLRMFVVPSVPVVDLQTLFTAPFTLQ